MSVTLDELEKAVIVRVGVPMPASCAYSAAIARVTTFGRGNGGISISANTARSFRPMFLALNVLIMGA